MSTSAINCQQLYVFVLTWRKRYGAARYQRMKAKAENKVCVETVVHAWPAALLQST